MRHAKSSWQDATLADHDRPLNRRGNRAAPRMAAFLHALQLWPDRILTSSATRARSTADVFVNWPESAVTLRIDDRLYLASAKEVIRIVAAQGDSAEVLMVVGHNPGLEELVERLSGGYERLPTAAVAVLRLPINRWEEVNEATRGHLEAVYRPKELD
jgi:phosphohistidine phosphatase